MFPYFSGFSGFNFSHELRKRLTMGRCGSPRASHLALAQSAEEVGGADLSSDMLNLQWGIWWGVHPKLPGVVGQRLLSIGYVYIYILYIYMIYTYYSWSMGFQPPQVGIWGPRFFVVVKSVEVKNLHPQVARSNPRVSNKRCEFSITSTGVGS